MRDRSPTVSETDSDSDLDDLPDSLGRIIVPPHVNCVVSDKFVRGQLPSILNAKVSFTECYFRLAILYLMISRDN